MKNSITLRKRLTITALGLVIVVLFTAIALIKPRVSHAATRTEVPALQFGPVFVQPGQNANLCAMNWGDTTIHVVLGIVSANNTSTILAQMEKDVVEGGGLCLPFSNSAPVSAPTASVNLVGVIAVRSALGATWESGLRSLGTSLQVTDGTSNTVRAFIPPVAVPVAQLPTALVSGAL